MSYHKLGRSILFMPTSQREYHSEIQQLQQEKLFNIKNHNNLT